MANKNPLLRRVKKFPRISPSCGDPKKFQPKSLPCGHPKIPAEKPSLAEGQKISTEIHSNSVRMRNQPEKTMIIGKFCKEFRTTGLNKRHIDPAPDTCGTLSAFEHGNSTNMNHLATYYRFSNTEQKTLFIEGVKNALEEMTNGN